MSRKAIDRLPDDRAPAAGAAPGASFAGAVAAIVWKDLVVELRAREIVPSVTVFALLVVVLFHFALPVEPGQRQAVAPGALWVALLFGSTLGLSRGMSGETDTGGATGLLLSPADRGALFVGKWLAGYLFSLLVALLLLPAIAVMLDVPVSSLPVLAGIVALGLVGWVATGTLLGAMAAATRAREVLLPVLLYPVVLPLVVPAVQASTRLVAGAGSAELVAPLALVVAYDVIFLVLSFLLFSLVLEG